MNVLYLHCTADMYGASRCLLNLIEHRRSEGHHAIVVLPETGPLARKLREGGADVVIDEQMPVLQRRALGSPVGMFRLWIRYVRAIRRYAGLARRYQADLVHTNVATVLAGGEAAARAGVPHVTHVRETFGEFGPLWRPYRWHVLRHSDRLVCVSRSVARQFGEPAPEKVTHVYDGLPAAQLSVVTDAAVQQMRKKYGLDVPGLLLVGLVGRIKWKRKGQETFVRAAARLVAEFPEVRFVMVGGVYPGNESHLLRTQALISELGVGRQVLLLGEEEDIYPLMKAFDIAVTASGLPEPFGMVTIEAMGLGVPVVGTAIGATAEIIEPGETGLLVAPSDPVAMASAIHRLLADPALRKRMGESGRERYLSEFELEAHCRSIARVYHELLGGAGGGA